MVELLVDRRVVEEVEVVKTADVAAVVDLEGDRPPATSTRCARETYEQVTDESPDRVRGVARDGHAHEVVSGARKKRHVRAWVVQQPPSVAVAPVIFHTSAEPQVLHAGAASLEDLGDRTRLGEPAG